MDIESVKTFIELANCRNFSKTADILHVVQSTVSNRIRSLEDYLGTQLVTREKSGVRLTAAGAVFLRYAQQLVRLDKDAQQEIHMASVFEDGLNIACVQWLFDYYLREPLVRSTHQNPQITTNLTIAHSEEIVPLLQDHVYDAALISYKVNSPSLVSVPMSKTKIVFVGEREEYGRLAGGIEKQALTDIPLIYSDIWEDYLSDISEHTLVESRLYEVRCNMLDSAKAFCTAGAGCCFLPEVMIRRELDEGTLVRIPIRGLRDRYIQPYLIYNRSRLDAPALRAWFATNPDFAPEEETL